MPSEPYHVSVKETNHFLSFQTLWPVSLLGGDLFHNKLSMFIQQSKCPWSNCLFQGTGTQKSQLVSGDPFHARNTALDARWPSKSCRPVSYFICIKIKLKSAADPPSAKGRADPYPSASQFHPFLNPNSGVATQVSVIQTNNPRIDFSEENTLKRGKEEKNVQNLNSPLAQLLLTYLWCHLFLVSSEKYFLTLWWHTHSNVWVKAQAPREQQ